MNSADPKFDRLMTDYKAACPEPDATLGFMPSLWSRIEAQKRFLKNARGWASAYVMAAAVICLLLVVLIAFQAGRTTHTTYVDVLDDSQDSSVLVEAGSVKENN